MVQKKSITKQLESSNGKKNEKPKNAYFLSLELENVRCFSENQKVNFSDDNENPRRWTIILGNNGTGKTTLLQILISVAPIQRLKEGKLVIDTINGNFLSNTEYHNSFQNRKIPVSKFDEVLGSIKSNNFDFSGVTKNGCGISLKICLQSSINQEKKTCGDVKKSRAKLSSSNKEKINLVSFEIYGSSIEDELKKPNVKGAYFAYGASRKSGNTSISEQTEESNYITLFNDSSLLINPEEWLLQADYASKRRSKNSIKSKRQLEQVKDILVKILPNISEIRFNEKERAEKRIPIPIVEFNSAYGWVEAKDLSLGYRTSMAWIVDFASRMFDLYPESENPLAEPAVVLIDEIDLHLHPKWQRELLDYLSNLFPNTQFIVTTHSPLIVQSAVARDANIVVCRREGDHVVIDQITDALKNMRVDQILTGEYFNLPTARPKEIEPLLEERENILSKAKLTKKDEKRLTELENEIGVMPVSENPEDDKAMDIIRRAAERLESQK